PGRPPAARRRRPRGPRGPRRRPAAAGQGHRRHPGRARRAGRSQRSAPRPLESRRTVPDRTDVLMKSGLLVAGAVLVAAAVIFVWRPRSTTTIAGLLAVLAGAVVWSVCSALGLGAGDLTGRGFDLKYVAACLRAPASLAFVLQCGGRTRWPGWLGPVLALEPVAILLLLAFGATHHLGRWDPGDAAAAAREGA